MDGPVNGFCSLDPVRRNLMEVENPPRSRPKLLRDGLTYIVVIGRLPCPRAVLCDCARVLHWGLPGLEQWPLRGRDEGQRARAPCQAQAPPCRHLKNSHARRSQWELPRDFGRAYPEGGSVNLSASTPESACSAAC